MPDDVECAFHPGKRATQVCDGTGSYICALCAVTVGEQTFSAEFLNSGGLKKLQKADAFQRTLPRPDITAWSCVLLALISSCTIIGPVLLAVVALIYYFKHVKLRRENPLYARVCSRATTVLLPILLGLGLLAGIAAVALVAIEGY
ncbi:MAG: hypothetical protein AAGG38_08175 [Planctomycetota bacterium]